jgi:hypothetical protein
MRMAIHSTLDKWSSLSEQGWVGKKVTALCPAKTIIYDYKITALIIKKQDVVVQAIKTSGLFMRGL